MVCFTLEVKEEAGARLHKGWEKARQGNLCDQIIGQITRVCALLRVFMLEAFQKKRHFKGVLIQMHKSSG